MRTVPQLAAAEHAAVARIRALAVEEGERRFRAAAEEVGLALGEYRGRACATTEDVGRVFGVTPQAIRKLLGALIDDLPGASVALGGAALAEVRNLKLRTSSARTLLVLWPGFLACALRGRTDVARRLSLALVRAEERERLASAAAFVTQEEYARLVDERNALVAEKRRLAAYVEQELPRIGELAARLDALEARAPGAAAGLTRDERRELNRLRHRELQERQLALPAPPAPPMSDSDVERIAAAVARHVGAPAAPAGAAGAPGPGATLPPPGADAAFARLVDAWWRAHGASPVSARILRVLAAGAGVLRDLVPAGHTERAEQVGIADAVIARAGRAVGGLIVRTSYNPSAKTRRYRLEPSASRAGGGAR